MLRLLLVGLLIAGLGIPMGVESPIAHASNHVDTTIASWYSLPKHRTANGERMKPAGMTVAHKSLPFGAVVEMKSRSTGKTIIVRVNDRGPYVQGRGFDLTPAAFKALGHQLGEGVVDITYKVLHSKAV